MCICIDGMGDPRWGTLGPSGHSVGKTFVCIDGMGDPRWGKTAAKVCETGGVWIANSGAGLTPSEGLGLWV